MRSVVFFFLFGYPFRGWGVSGMYVLPSFNVFYVFSLLWRPECLLRVCFWGQQESWKYLFPFRGSFWCLLVRLVGGEAGPSNRLPGVLCFFRYLAAWKSTAWKST